MQTGHVTIEYRGNPVKKSPSDLSPFAAFRICAGAGFFCGVMAFGMFMWMFA